MPCLLQDVQEGALFRKVAADHQRVRQGVLPDRRAEAHRIVSGPQAALLHLQGPGRHQRQPRRRAHRFVGQIFRRHDRVGQPQADHRLRVQCVAGVVEFVNRLGMGQERQDQEGRQGAVADFRLRQPRGLRDDGQIGGHGNGGPGADRMAVDRRDRRLAQVPDLEEQLGIGADQAFERRDRAVLDQRQVPTGGEGAVAGPGQDHRAHVLVRLEDVQRVNEFAVGHGHTQGVQLFRPVDDDPADRAPALQRVPFDGYVPIVHAAASPCLLRRPRPNVFHGLTF